MRKHNVKFAQRVTRVRHKDGTVDRSNLSPMLSHRLTNDKGFQLSANGLLPKLFARVGLLKTKEVAHA